MWKFDMDTLRFSRMVELYIDTMTGAPVFSCCDWLVKLLGKSDWPVLRNLTYIARGRSNIEWPTDLDGCCRGWTALVEILVERMPCLRRWRLNLYGKVPVTGMTPQLMSLTQHLRADLDVLFAPVARRTEVCSVMIYLEPYSVMYCTLCKKWYWEGGRGWEIDGCPGQNWPAVSRYLSYT